MELAIYKVAINQTGTKFEINLAFREAYQDYFDSQGLQDTCSVLDFLCKYLEFGALLENMMVCLMGNQGTYLVESIDLARAKDYDVDDVVNYDASSKMDQMAIGQVKGQVQEQDSKSNVLKDLELEQEMVDILVLGQANKLAKKEVKGFASVKANIVELFEEYAEVILELVANMAQPSGYQESKKTLQC